MRERARPHSAALLGLLLLAAPLTGCGGGGESDLLPPETAEDTAAPVAIPPELKQQRERIVAEVNGQPVHAWKLDEVYAMVKAQVQAQGVPIPPRAEPELRKAALQLVISNEVVHQQALSEGMSVDPRLLDQRLQELRSRYGSEEEFRAFLRSEAITEDDLRAEAEYSMLVQQWVQSMTGDVSVDESAARELYEAWKEYLKEPEQARAAFILIKSSPDDPPAMREDARGRIEEAYQRIQDGTDFAQVAREYSQAPAAAQGGDVGFFPRGVMAPQFEEQAFTLPIGEVSEIFETAFGLNILKVLDRKEARQMSFEEVKPNLMLAAAQQKESDALGEKVQALLDAAEIKVMETFGGEKVGGEEG